MEDSGIEEPIRPWATSEDEELRTLAEEVRLARHAMGCVADPAIPTATYILGWS